MDYALDHFTMHNTQLFVVQGSQSLFTYQNTGAASATIQGSNDASNWSDIASLASGASLVKEHSYKYLRCLGDTQVSVNRGEGDNTIGGGSSGGTADYPSFTGNANKVLTVTSTEDDVEWIAAVTQVYVDTQDGLLQDQIDLKADAISVSQSLDTKADAMATSQSLALKADLIGGLIPASQLPSYVDDVLNFPDLASFPFVGEDGKIYIAEDVNKTYRWGGSSYVEIGGGGVALGETSSTAYRGDNGKIAYDHTLSQGNPHNATTTDIDEGTKLFFTESRVNQTVLTGLDTSTASPALATDQLLAAIGKLQAQINNIAPPVWVNASSIGTTHAAFTGLQFAKINGLLWVCGSFSNGALIGAGTILFLLTNSIYRLDIPSTAFSQINLGEVLAFDDNFATKRILQLRNVPNSANYFSLNNEAVIGLNSSGQIQPTAIGLLLTP